MNTLPEKLQKLRKHYKFSQEYVAQVLEISIEDYMARENGRILPNYEELLSLCQLYKIDLKELFVNECEVTLYEVDDTTTDQINIDYFMRQYRWYNRFFRYLKKNKGLQCILISVLLVILIILALQIRKLRQPLEFDVSQSERLSVSDRNVAYVLNDNRLEVSGFLDDVSDEQVIKAVSGNDFIAVLKEDGTVNIYGSTSDMKQKASELKNIEDILSADDHVIARDKFGKYYAFGGNKQSEITLESMKNVTGLKTFGNCSIAIGEDGYLVYAGEVVGRSQFKRYRYPLDYDANSQMTVVLKSDGTVDYSAYEDHYTTVMGWKDIIQIACGDNFIAGLQKNGKVLLAGGNEEMVEEVLKWSGIIAIDAGKDYLIGFDGNYIVGTGNNEYNQFVKTEKTIERADTIDPSTLVVTFGEDTITVEFEAVKNAYAYHVSLVAGTTTTYEIGADEKAVFSLDGLSEGVYYNISIVSLGNSGYEDSIPYDYNFEYRKPEIKKEEEIPQEKTVEMNQYIGKKKEELEEYLKMLGFQDENITAVESENECTNEDVLIESLEGYEEGEQIKESEIKKRTVTFRYCRLKKNEE